MQEIKDNLTVPAGSTSGVNKSLFSDSQVQQCLTSSEKTLTKEASIAPSLNVARKLNKETGKPYPNPFMEAEPADQQLSKITTIFDSIFADDTVVAGRRDTSFFTKVGADRWTGGNVQKFVQGDTEYLRQLTIPRTREGQALQRAEAGSISRMTKVAHIGHQIILKYGDWKTFATTFSKMNLEEKITLFFEWTDLQYSNKDGKIAYYQRTPAQQSWAQQFRKNAPAGMEYGDHLFAIRNTAKGELWSDKSISEWKGMEYVNQYIPKVAKVQTNKDNTTSLTATEKELIAKLAETRAEKAKSIEEGKRLSSSK
jgi:hypothetical protein